MDGVHVYEYGKILHSGYLGRSVQALMVPEFPAYNYSFSAKT